jgi:hypothetical protein
MSELTDQVAEQEGADPSMPDQVRLTSAEIAEATALLRATRRPVDPPSWLPSPPHGGFHHTQFPKTARRGTLQILQWLKTWQFAIPHPRGDGTGLNKRSTPASKATTEPERWLPIQLCGVRPDANRQD